MQRYWGHIVLLLLVLKLWLIDALVVLAKRDLLTGNTYLKWSLTITFEQDIFFIMETYYIFLIMETYYIFLIMETYYIFFIMDTYNTFFIMDTYIFFIMDTYIFLIMDTYIFFIMDT